jgi:predicted PurR-regulated permease PerM
MGGFYRAVLRAPVPRISGVAAIIGDVTIFHESEDLGGRLRRIGVLSWSVIGIMLLLATVFRFVIYPIRSIFPPLALAFIVVFLLNPIINRLVTRTRLRRLWATLLVYMIFVGIATTIAVNVVPLIAHQISALLDQLPEYVERATREINRVLGKRSSFRIHVTSSDVVSFIESHRAAVLNFLGHVRAFGESLLRVVVAFLLAMVLSFYILVDLPKIRRALINALPLERQQEVLDLGKQVSGALGAFFRGQLLVAVFVGAASAIGLAVFVRLPFAVLVGVVAGIFNLVPLIGPFIGAIPAVFIGLLSGNPNKAWQSMIVLLVVQQIDNHIISPNVMGRTVRLHPLTVILALLGGGTLAGIGGMLIVVPAVAVTKILAAYAWEHRRRFVAPARGGQQ